MPDGAEVVAATAACVAAAIVAWQSWETRKSANASREAAQAAAAGLETANDALEIARQEEGHSRALVVEAHRARIDATLPAISVIPQQTIFWPPTLSPNPYQANSWERCPLDASFTLPADARKALGVQGRIGSYNGSQRVVQLRVDYLPMDGGERVYDRVVTLAPGADHSIEFLAWTWIEHWVTQEDAATRSLEGQPPGVSYSDQLDSGGSISWSFAISHAPIYQTHDSEPGRYRLISAEPSPGRSSPGSPSLIVQREYRTYWLSRPDGIELPSPEVAE